MCFVGKNSFESIILCRAQRNRTLSTPEPAAIREANQSDIDEIVRLWIAMMQEHMRFEPRLRLSPAAGENYASYVASHLRRPDSLCLVVDDAASDQPRLAAFCLAYISENLPMFEPSLFGFVSDVAVDESNQRQGLGARLMNRVRDWMRERKVGEVHLQVYANNAKGQAFWDKQGFTSFFERKWLAL